MGVEKGRILTGGTHAEFVHVVLAQQHRAGTRQPVNHGGVVWRNVVFQYLRRAGGADIFGGNAILSREWDAGEGRDIHARLQALIGLAGLLQR